jgi:DNA polymerase-3 subunit alpha
MSDRPFVHLHCHSHYSLLDGANRIPELVARAKKLGMTALALTDHGNLYGAIEFYSECKAAGINPVIGYEAYVAPGKRSDREARRRGDAGYHLTLLARNEGGFRNLIKMASVAFLEGYHYVPRIDKELLETYKDGLICLSGCASSEFSEAILKDQLDEATQLAQWFATTFGKHFYIEIQNNGLEIQKQQAAGAIDIAKKLGLPLVATCDAHYLCQADNDAHDVLLCINTGKTRSDPNRMRYGSDQFYVRAPEEMYRLFPDHADAVKRSQEIADGVDIKLDFKKRHFPVFTPPGKKKPEDYLRELCAAGLKERYGAKPPKAALERLEHELGIICRMGFASYFLIVWDFVRFAREQSIPCSARGSACGAVVSYVLQLSHVDPLEYDLLFERFLDPNRSEAPDIDIDFCQERREEVIAYVRQKYGEESVAQIGTFGTMAARAAIKDVGRVMDVPLERVIRLTNFVPKVLNISLDESLQQSPDLKKEYDNDPQVHELIDIARKLEGTNRNAGTHAAGVVIADGPLTDHVPLQRVVRKGEEGAGKNGEAVVTTQWVMGDLEKVGLLKMDFLGLRTLTLLDNAVRLIEKTRGLQIDLFNLPANDQKTYALLQKGDAKGVFQLESDGIRELLKRMKPDNIRDIVAIMALYRPGPLQGGMVDAYVNCKHGREKPHYSHAVMEEVLTETYGVMVYQEQIMRILNRLGGIELSSAYACIKAISKKKQEIIDQRREDFFKGAQKRGLDKVVCEEIWNKIIVFAGYGFNKSHTAAYAQVGYQTAYLKAHYTAEFMAALLSSEIEDGNKRDIMVEHFDDARRLGVEVLPPNINTGDIEFTVADGKIVFGLCAIKGVGRGCCAEIVRARQEKGPFKDIFDFCERVDLKIVQRAAVEKLIKAGAFDCFDARRAQLWAVLPGALQVAQEVQQDRRKGQGGLFDAAGDADGEASPTSLPDIPEWPNNEKLKYEKEALDFYFSSHPLAQHAQDLRGFSTHTTTQLADVGPQQEVVIGGMLTQVRLQNTKKPGRNGHSRYARCKLEDLEGAVECVMWPDDFVRYKDTFLEDRICFVKAQVERVREEPSLRLLHLLDIDQAKRELTRGLLLSVSSGELSPGALDGVSLILQRARGSCPVFLSVRDPGGKRAVLKLANDYSVNPSTVSVAELESLLGSGHVGFTGLGNGKRNGNGAG